MEGFGDFVRSSLLPRALEECEDPDGEDAAGSEAECEVDGVDVHGVEEIVEECEVVRYNSS